MRFAKLTPIVAILALAACDSEPETTAETPVIQEEGAAVEQETAEMEPVPAEEPEPTVTAERETAEEIEPVEEEVTVIEPETDAAPQTEMAETTEVEPIIEGGGEAEVTVSTPEGGDTQTTAAAPATGMETTTGGETTGAISATTAAMVEPGSYASDQLSLALAEDGTFTLTGPGGDEVEGDWRVFDDTMTLSNASGATGTADFPMTCTVAEEEEGFRITAETGSCEMLDGQVFQPQG
jgi:hypothetical protein